MPSLEEKEVDIFLFNAFNLKAEWEIFINNADVTDDSRFIIFFSKEGNFLILKDWLVSFEIFIGERIIKCYSWLKYEKGSLKCFFAEIVITGRDCCKGKVWVQWLQEMIEGNIVFLVVEVLIQSGLM